MDIERILDFIFPPVCIGCQEIGEWICSICYKKYFKKNIPECMFCRVENDRFNTHKECAITTKIDRCIICWRYNKLSKKIMKVFKYNYRYAISNYLSKRVIEQFHEYFSPDLVLIPVPSHPSKTKERGFNQSKLLASKIAKLENLQILEPLERVTESIQHAGMKRKERISDENPFRLIPEFSPQVQNKKLMIIDDVCTTGTTLIHCASELRKANPTSVSALALFRGKK
jgi:ComF family protein